MSDEAPPCAGDGSCQARYKDMKAKIAELSAKAQAMREALNNLRGYLDEHDAGLMTSIANGWIATALSSDAHRLYMERLEKAEKSLAERSKAADDYAEALKQAFERAEEAEASRDSYRKLWCEVTDVLEKQVRPRAEAAEARCAEKDQRIAALEKEFEALMEGPKGLVRKMIVARTRKLIAERDSLAAQLSAAVGREKASAAYVAALKAVLEAATKVSPAGTGFHDLGMAIAKADEAERARKAQEKP